MPGPCKSYLIEDLYQEIITEKVGSFGSTHTPRRQPKESEHTHTHRDTHRLLLSRFRVWGVVAP